MYKTKRNIKRPYLIALYLSEQEGKLIRDYATKTDQNVSRAIRQAIMKEIKETL